MKSRKYSQRVKGLDDLQLLQSQIGRIFSAVPVGAGGWRIAALRTALVELVNGLAGLLGEQLLPVCEKRLLVITAACARSMIAAEQRDLLLDTLNQLEQTIGEIPAADCEQLCQAALQAVSGHALHLSSAVNELLAEIDDAESETGEAD